jgi:hypothetical protein
MNLLCVFSIENNEQIKLHPLKTHYELVRKCVNSSNKEFTYSKYCLHKRFQIPLNKVRKKL